MTRLAVDESAQEEVTVTDHEEYSPKLALRAARRRRPDPPETPFHAAIRDATEPDVPYMLEIYNHYVANTIVTFDEEPMALTTMRDKLAHTRKLGYPWLVAENPTGQILGFAYVFPWKQKSAYRFTVENSIYLGPAATGKGLGALLLGELLDRSKQAGLKEVIAVIADPGAEASIKLHERFGFKEIGRMGKVGFKFGRWLGTVMMQKSIK